MIKKSKSESGQAIIILAIALVALLAFAALAIDGGMLYAARRSAQNAVDAAALSGATAKCKGTNITTAATNAAAANGFTNGGDVSLQINNPPATGTYSGNANYVEVVITSTYKPAIAGLITKTALKNTVRAMGVCSSGSGGTQLQPALGGGVALMSLSPNKPNAIYATGGGTVITVNGNIIDNSTDPTAYYVGPSAALNSNWIKVRGGASVGGSTACATQMDVGGDLAGSGVGNINVTGPMNVYGNITAQNLIITSNLLTTGGNLTMTGAGGVRLTGPANINGNINFVNGSVINGHVTYEGTKSGGGTFTPAPTQGPVTAPTFNSTTYPVQSDPLLNLVNPPSPVPAAGTCSTALQPFPGTGTKNYTGIMTSGSYYCNINLGSGDANVTIPPGTYWVDYINLGGNGNTNLNGSTFYVTGRGLSGNGSLAVSVGNSAKVSANGTMFYIKNGSFQFSGAQITTTFTAPTTGPYQGMALYMDRADTSSTVSFAGSRSGDFSGTVYAAPSACSFTGSTAGLVYSAQFLCDTIAVTGSSTLTINYDGSLVYQTPVSVAVPQVSLVQ